MTTTIASVVPVFFLLLIIVVLIVLAVFLLVRLRRQQFEIDQLYGQPIDSKVSPAAGIEEKHDTSVNVHPQDLLKPTSPPTTDYEEPKDLESVQQEMERNNAAFENPVYDSNVTDKYDGPINDFVNRMYGSTAGVKKQEYLELERMASPYEVPVVLNDDYELPHDGNLM